MPLVIVYERGRLCPRFICDLCDEAIDDAHQANYQFAHPDRLAEGERVAPIFVHKACAARWSPLAVDWTHWTPLSAMMVYLATSTALDWDTARKTAAAMALVV